MSRLPPLGQGLLIHEISRSHTTTHRTRWYSSGRMISSSQRPLPDNTHNTHNRQTSMPPVGFEPTISAGERPPIYDLDRAAKGTGYDSPYIIVKWKFSIQLQIATQFHLVILYGKMKIHFCSIHWIILHIHQRKGTPRKKRKQLSINRVK